MGKTNEWAGDRSNWPAGFTAGRDGWFKWYRGQSRFVCAKTTPLSEVPERWDAKRKAIDDQVPGPVNIVTIRSLREVTSEFLEYCRNRTKTGRPRKLSPRTLHNYVEALNDFGAFVGGNTPIHQANSPAVFSKYAKRFPSYEAAAWDSVVTRVSAMFNWAVEMEYIDRYRPGPEFIRPAKEEIRSDRIDLTKSIPVKQVAELYEAANQTMRCWIGLGICCGFINTDIAHVPRSVVDLEKGVIDFRRRKYKRVRRVCPLPDQVVSDMKGYVRPDPAQPQYADRFFLTEYGVPYGRIGANEKPLDSISPLWRKLRVSVNNESVYTGLRTTLYNLWPKSGYDVERKIVMGRAQGDIDLDHYMEDVGLDRIRHCVNSVWSQVKTELDRLRAERVRPSASGASPAHREQSA